MDKESRLRIEALEKQFKLSAQVNTALLHLEHAASCPHWKSRGLICEIRHPGRATERQSCSACERAYAYIEHFKREPKTAQTD